ncbi:MAG: HAMP domain-containing histidine kinase [Clostridia bacterium]|nr:HAMP domain-containing histidine kinase [Clostridia bacterium]
MTRRKRGAPKIKWSLFVSFTAITALILMMVTLLQVLLIDTVYGFTVKSRMRSLVYEIGYLANSESFSEDAETLAQESSTALAVYLIDGSSQTLIAESTEHLSVLERLDSAEIETIYRFAKENGGFFQETLGDTLKDNRFSPNERKGRLLSAFVDERADGSTLLILLDTARTPMKHLVLLMQNHFSLVSVLMLAVSAGIAFLLARHIAAPIERISGKAKRMAKGEYDLDFSENSYREIAELSEILNQTSDELTKVDRMQKELVANISHDLRTPLTMIVGYAEVMRDIEGENTPENVQVIIDEATRLSALVNDLLEISRFQGGIEECKMTSFDMVLLANETVERYRRLKENSGFTFGFEAKGEAPVLADRAKIAQVLCNLINNAMNYSAEEKTVYLRVLCDDVRVRVEVEDHGIGISAEDLPNVWNRYYRVDRKHRRSVTGSGLGLSIVREIFELHSARYGVSSELGRGTTFWFELPLYSDALPAERV